MPFIPAQRDPASGQVATSARKWLDRPVNTRSGQFWPRTSPHAQGKPPSVGQLWPRGTGVTGTPDLVLPPRYNPPPTVPNLVNYYDGSQGNLTNPTVTVTDTVAPGDVVVVMMMTNNGAGTVSIAGLGATWTLAAQSTVGGGTADFAVFIGLGPTSAGTATITGGGGQAGVVRAWLVRGVNNPSSFYVNVGFASISVGNSFTMPPLGVLADQFALLAQGTTTTTGNSFFTGLTPSTGWTAESNASNVSGSPNVVMASQHWRSSAFGTHVYAGFTNVSGFAKGFGYVQVLLGDSSSPIHRVGQPSKIINPATFGTGLPFPQTPTPQNLLICAMVNNAATITPPAAFWNVGPVVHVGANLTLGIYYRVSDGHDPTPTFSVGSGPAAVMEEWTGLNIGASAVHDVDGAGATSTTQPATLTDSLTTTAAGLVIAAVGGIQNIAADWTVGALTTDCPLVGTALSGYTWVGLAVAPAPTPGAQSVAVGTTQTAGTIAHALATTAFKAA